MAEPYAEHPPTAPPEAPRRRPSRWMLTLGAGWALVLVVGIVWASVRGEPTVREQTTIAQAAATVDRAAADVVAAATADGLSVVAVSAFERVDECGVTVIRPGARYQRTITALVAPATEESLLRRVSARLPASYSARVRPGAAPRLIADAGYYVAVSAGVIAPGLVRFVIDTGCRAEGDLTGPSAAPEEISAPLRAAVMAALSELAVTPQRWSVEAIACGDEKLMASIQAIGAPGALPSLQAEQGALGRALDAALVSGDPAGAKGSVVLATPELFAYRSGQVALGVRSADGHPVVTATGACS